MFQRKTNYTSYRQLKNGIYPKFKQIKRKYNKNKTKLFVRIISILLCLVIIMPLIQLIYLSLNDTDDDDQDNSSSTIPPINLWYSETSHKSDDLSLEEEAEEMRNEILSRVKELQRPEVCESAEYLVCQFKDACGIGCTTNNVIECLSHGQMEQKTVVLNTDCDGLRWWHDLFLPISKCQDYYDQNKQKIDSDPSTIQFAQRDENSWQLHRDWVPEYTKSFCNTENMQYPVGWFLGILNVYLYRGFQLPVEQYIWAKRERFMNEIKGIGYIGCHIRRTDKVINGEMVRFELREYVNEIDHFGIMKRDENGKRGRNYHGHYDEDYGIDVYLATDTMEVVDELRSNPYWKHGYNWILNENGTEIAGKWTDERLKNFNGQMDAIFDIIMLTEADYFVGTFSSNLGRLVFQLFAYKYVDPAEFTVSLDEKYFGRV